MPRLPRLFMTIMLYTHDAEIENTTNTCVIKFANKLHEAIKQSLLLKNESNGQIGYITHITPETKNSLFSMTIKSVDGTDMATQKGDAFTVYSPYL